MEQVRAPDVSERAVVPRRAVGWPREQGDPLAILRYGLIMQAGSIRGVVRGGRLRVDVPTDLPEGSEIELVPLEEEDEERQRMEDSIRRGLADSAAGRTRSAREFVERRKSHP